MSDLDNTKILFRVSKEDKKKYMEKAQSLGLSLSGWIKGLILRECGELQKANVTITLTKRQKKDLREVFKEEAELLFVEANAQKRVMIIARASLRSDLRKIDEKPIIKYLNLLEETIYKKYTKKQLMPVNDCLERIHNLRKVENISSLLRTDLVMRLIDDGRSPEDIREMLDKYDKNKSKIGILDKLDYTDQDIEKVEIKK